MVSAGDDLKKPWQQYDPVGITERRIQGGRVSGNSFGFKIELDTISVVNRQTKMGNESGYIRCEGVSERMGIRMHQVQAVGSQSTPEA